MSSLDTLLSSIPSIKKPVLAKLQNMGLLTVGDLFSHLPHRYEDYATIRPIASLAAGEKCTVLGTVTKLHSGKSFRKRMLVTEISVADDSGTLRVVWFNQRFIATALKVGSAVRLSGKVTADKGGLACAKLVVFANAVDDNPFMAGAFHGVGEPECVVNVGVSGPGVVRAAVKDAKGKDLGEISEIIKKVGFKITRMGELVGREISRRLNVEFGILDVSLAPTPAEGDSVAEILEAMGLERVGAPGTTAALALLNDAMKKGGAFASSYVGGLSGAFIPVSEDQGMIRAAREGVLSIEKLEAMTAVCSVGLDMIAIPGDTSAETISAIIADEAAIGVINNKTTAVRLIPVPGKKVGDMVYFGGLLGEAPIIPVSRLSSKEFIDRGGRIPAPIQGMKN